VNDQFVVELAHTEIESLEKLNSLFSAWVESVYHRQVHSETGAAPIERFLSAGAPAAVDSALLHDAFLWSEKRKVTKTAEASLFGNAYEVDPALVGQQIELVFSPFDLTDIEVRFQGRPMGKAVPRHISRHVHPAARHEPGEGEKEKKPSGIDYLALVEARRAAELARRIDYRDIGPSAPSAGGGTTASQEGEEGAR
jgi:putative transposase